MPNFVERWAGRQMERLVADDPVTEADLANARVRRKYLDMIDQLYRAGLLTGQEKTNAKDRLYR